MASLLLWIALGLLLALGLLAALFFFGMRGQWPPVLTAVRHFNRAVTNPRMQRDAGTPGAYASVVRHVGRRSGRPYETPVVVVPADDGFLIALPYGTTADWLRNVLAAGTATLVHEGSEVDVDSPEVVPLADVEHLFPADQLPTLHRFRVRQALQVRKAEVPLSP